MVQFIFQIRLKINLDSGEPTKVGNHKLEVEQNTNVSASIDPSCRFVGQRQQRNILTHLSAF